MDDEHIECQECRKVIKRNNWRQKYCLQCSAHVQRKKDRERREKERNKK